MDWCQAMLAILYTFYVQISTFKVLFSLYIQRKPGTKERMAEHSPEAVSFLSTQIDHEGQRAPSLWNLIFLLSFSQTPSLKENYVCGGVQMCVHMCVQQITRKPTLSIRCLPLISLHLYFESLLKIRKPIDESRLAGQCASVVCLSVPPVLALSLCISTPGFPVDADARDQLSHLPHPQGASGKVDCCAIRELGPALPPRVLEDHQPG